MTNLLGLVPTLLLFSSTVLLWTQLSPWSVAGFFVAAVVWGFERYFQLLPKKPDDSRIIAVEKQLAEAVRQLDSLRTSFNLKQLR